MRDRLEGQFKRNYERKKLIEFKKKETTLLVSFFHIKKSVLSVLRQITFHDIYLVLRDRV